jgi:hypothetical protein
MLKRQAGKSVEQSPQGTQRLEHPYCERVRHLYDILHASGIETYTYTFIDSWYLEATVILYELEDQTESTFKALIEVIISLREARNELRHARFLFDVEEVNAVYRLILRNRAVLKSKEILLRIILGWPRR